MKTIEASIYIGDGVVVVKRKGNSGTAIANVLGTENNSGIQLIYLDRLIHEQFESELGGYSVSGAISTIISTNAPTSAPSFAQA